MMLAKLLLFTALSTTMGHPLTGPDELVLLNFEYHSTWWEESDNLWKQELRITDVKGTQLHVQRFDVAQPGCTAEGQMLLVSSSCWSGEWRFRCRTDGNGFIRACAGGGGTGTVEEEEVHLDVGSVAYVDSCSGVIVLDEAEGCDSEDAFSVRMDDAVWCEEDGGISCEKYADQEPLLV